ncbi:MAG TPA: ADOP family duplicated permease [Acidobacteriaceae bacterium]|jgi:predicted permease|nr:ADOP family duplicated permease [Acidobacteriaceae bacterium]
MSLRAAMRRLWRSVAPRTPSDVEAEFRSTLDAYREDLIRQGLPAEEARRKARIDLGRPAAQNETYRAAIGLRLFDELGGDIRYGFRALGRNPGFAAVAVLSLALGIGATTAMFSLIYAVLLHPFPYAGADRIMNPILVDQQHPDGYEWFSLSKPQLDEMRRAAPVESVIGFNNGHMEITGDGLPEDIWGVYLTENAGTFFGVRPLLGRTIEPSDAGHSVVVLNYRFWRSHFGGDPHVIGRTLEIDQVPWTIIGVMPRSFAFSDVAGVGDVYLPASQMRDLANIPSVSYVPWIKLKPHVTLAAANAALEPLVPQLAKQPLHTPDPWHLALQPIIVPYRQDTGRTLTLLLAGVVLLLIIGCANCSILMLACGRTRLHELAIRSAIGASRWRIVRQLLIEAVIISSTGAVPGVAAAYWLGRLPLLLSPDSFPAESVIRINLPILAFSVALALLCGILFGLVPALSLSRHGPARMLPGRQTGVVAAPRKRRWSILIAAQVGLTLLLMATAGTAIRSFLRLGQTPLGYDPENVIKVGMMLHAHDPSEWSRIQSRAARTAYIEQIRDKIAAVPGVSTVAVGNDATPPYIDPADTFEIDGTGDHQQPQARVILVGKRYFSALHIPLLQGRIWNADENARGDFIAVVNRAFAARYLSVSNVVGRQVRIPGLTSRNRYQIASAQSASWRQIVGVVGDARNDGIDRPVTPAIYVPYTAVMQPYVQFFVRTQGDPLRWLHSIRTAIASVASDQQISTDGYNRTFTLNEAVEKDAQYTRQRLFSILFAIFSAMALGLALVGIFSLVAYSVAQRTAEFGIRLALGAPRAHVVWVAARIALVSAAAGMVLGLAVDSFLGAVLAHWMQNAFAAGSLFAAAALLALSALLACLLPARHAVAVPPAEALRYE